MPRQIKRMMTWTGQKSKPYMKSQSAKRSASFAQSRAVAIVPVSSRKKKSYGQSGPEVKFLDTAVAAGTTADSTAVVVSLNTLAQGSTNITRIGNKIQIISVEIKAVYDAGDAVGHSGNAHRVALVLDKEPEPAGIASYNEIYTANTVTSFRNIGESDRFVVLAVEEFKTDGSSATSTDECKFFTMFRNVDIASKYTLTTATQTAFGTNQLLLCFCSFVDDANSAWTITSRVRFTDE